ncbi:hypothetical protein WJX74_002080 [Apatococcus lobatus]|uniref:Uncharacterized protein n=1 Tax=Apatococcus lobatus TaxID=904363 RepID=A0AAW1Q2N6_9CHLO
MHSLLSMSSQSDHCWTHLSASQIKIQPLEVVRATGALLRKLPRKGLRKEARIIWTAGRTVKVAPYTANRELDMGPEETVPALDPTRITMLDAPGNDMIAFDAQVFFDGAKAKQLPINLFASAKRRAPNNSDIVDELLSENHVLARHTIRDQGATQKFFPVFLYVSMASTDRLAETLQRLAKQGQNDILVVSEDEMHAFLPVVASRPSLVALTGLTESSMLLHVLIPLSGGIWLSVVLWSLFHKLQVLIPLSGSVWLSVVLWMDVYKHVPEFVIRSAQQLPGS